MKLERHSPSSLNLFAASPAMWVLERVLGRRQPVGSPAHRGTAVEAGVAYGLLYPHADPSMAVGEALKQYDTASALSGDPRKDKYRASVEVMVLRALTELQPYGIPSSTQRFIEWRPEGLKYPIVGYSDFEWDNHAILTDLKTTDRLPEKVKITHARQGALYATSDNMDARITYVTPVKVATYKIENIRAHREALVKIALTVERFVSLTNDPQELVGLVVPDLESFYWSPPQARQAAFEVWGV
jgi:hypothetical protein